MKSEFLPTEYHLEVYQGSFRSDPCFFVQSSTPFGAMSVGDYFHSAATDQWTNPPDMVKERLVIDQIEHTFWSIDRSHNGHKIMVVLKTVAA